MPLGHRIQIPFNADTNDFARLQCKFLDSLAYVSIFVPDCVLGEAFHKCLDWNALVWPELVKQSLSTDTRGKEKRKCGVRMHFAPTKSETRCLAVLL